jgi:hypothetical protein
MRLPEPINSLQVAGTVEGPHGSNHLAACFLQVEGLQELAALLFLDISHNLVQQLDACQLPASIEYLKVSYCC